MDGKDKAMKYKAKVTRAYYIAIEDEDGNEVETDWCFLDYKQAKKEALQLLEKVEQREMWNIVIKNATAKRKSEESED